MIMVAASRPISIPPKSGSGNSAGRRGPTGSIPPRIVRKYNTAADSTYAIASAYNATAAQRGDTSLTLNRATVLSGRGSPLGGEIGHLLRVFAIVVVYPADDVGRTREIRG